MLNYSQLQNLTRVIATDIPKPTLEWLTLDKSITNTVGLVTQSTVHVCNREQGMSQAPNWLPLQYKQHSQSYVRCIELFAQSQRILIAGTYTHPCSDVIGQLEALGNEPLANLLFQSSSAHPGKQYFVQSGCWWGRVVEWSISNCEHPMLLVELFDPEFIAHYSPKPTHQPGVSS